jgi:predicted ATPase/DNA-binding SARP family transcriptional activator
LTYELRILGPLEVVRDGQVLHLGGPKPRALMAMLALGEPVPPDRLIDLLWPEYDEAAPARLQVYISQLRKALGDPAAIELRAGGYVLNAEALDSRRFESLAREGRDALAAGDPEAAASLLGEGLALWRGPAAEELGSVGRRLEELRLGAVEDRVDAELALGRHRELVAELEQLVAEQPLRERLRGALMLALYRDGRQADALDAYLAARRTLVDELGVEPGPRLQELHAAILAQDGALLVEPPEIRERRHLPAPATSLVGRRAQVDDVKALVRRVRLVTLTGTGGTGKTRLALQAASELAEHFEHGVYFVPLAPEAATTVPDAIAAALGVEERTEPIADTLKARLKDRRLLLLADNFEHVTDAAPLMSELLAAAPGLKVLATSRSPLRLYGEHEYAVPPLGEAEAVDLFVVRAAQHSSELGAEDAAAVVDICARLDGLPLAIELAAARSRTLSPAEMAAGLAPLELAGPRDVPERHRTLRATLDWSHALLSEREQALFAALGAFVGGFDAAAALAVGGAQEHELHALVDGSLLTRAGRRFDMLETVRHYAFERLADDTRTRHAEHFAALAEEAEPQLTADPSGTWMLRLEAEHANLRAALAWCADAGLISLELRLATALARFWMVRGHLREGRAWLEAVLTRDVEQPPGLRVKALLSAARIVFWQGDYPALNAFAGEALTRSEELGDRHGMAQALDGLATSVANAGDHARSMELYERSLALCRELDDVRMLAVSVSNVGCLAMMQGDYERAEELSREGLALHEQAGRRDGMQQTMFNLGVIALLTGRDDEAEELFERGLELSRELGFLSGIAYSLEGLAAVHAARGDGRRAAEVLGAAHVVGERSGVHLEPFEQELHDRTVATARGLLGDAAFESAFGTGEAAAPTG